MDGFAIGPTTNPCTKGIWAWSTAVKLNDSTDMIILDTEGLNSVCKAILIRLIMMIHFISLINSYLNTNREGSDN